MDAGELVGWLREQPHANAVDVVARLLGVCHREQTQLRERWAERRYARGTRTATADVERHIGDTRSLRLEGRLLGLIADRLEVAIAEIGAGLAAHAIADGIDAALGPDFGLYFDGEEERALAIGDPFPIHDAPTLLFVGKQDSPGRTSNLSPPLLRTPHLGIVTRDHGIAVRLRAVGSRLRPPHKRFKVAMVSTNGGHHEFMADVYDEEQRPMDAGADWSARKGYFYNVRPGPFGATVEAQHAAHERQKERIARGLHAAADAGCDLVVLPEFCATDDIHRWLLTLEPIRRIPLVVTGSRHVTTASGLGPGVNESVLLIRGRSVVRAAKFADFNIKLPPPLPDVPLYEDLDRKPAIQLVTGPGASVVLLICKDAMNEQVLEIVRELSPTFLLIPTMSPELDRFEAAARDLAHHPQIVTVLANIGPVTAMVARPSRSLPIISGSCDPGGVVRISLSDGIKDIL